MKTYIFDLYGTLIDIRTELQNDQIWKTLSDMYACYGAIYTPEEFKQAYLKFDQEEWKRVEAIHPGTYVDIQFKMYFNVCMMKLLGAKETDYRSGILIHGFYL